MKFIFNSPLKMHFNSFEREKKLRSLNGCCFVLSFDLHIQVIMGNRASAERACKDPNPIIDGRKANVNLAILGAKPRGNITSGK